MLARDIRADFDVQFAYHKRYAHLINEFGFDTFQCDNFDAEVVLEQSKALSYRWLNQHDLERILLSQIECISTVGPQMVVGDAAFTLKMAAEKCRVKMIGLINGNLSSNYACMRSVPRCHFLYGYSEKLPELVLNCLTHIIERVALPLAHAPFKAIRRQFCLQRTSTPFMS
jgi:hypothetical protein